MRFTKTPPEPHAVSAALGHVEDDDLAAVRVAEVVDEPVREHAVGEAREAAATRRCAQCSVGSIDDDGIRYGLTTHALIASTIAIAPTIVTIQSMIPRHGCGTPRRTSGFQPWYSSCRGGGAARAPARGGAATRTSSIESPRTASYVGSGSLSSAAAPRLRPGSYGS